MSRRDGHHIPAKIAFLIVATACLISAGCTGGLGTPQDTTPATVQYAEPLAGTAWNLISYRAANGSVIPVVPDSRTFITFGGDGTLSGTTRCNQYSTSYALNGSAIAIESVDITENYCARPAGLAQQESRYVELLLTARSYQVRDGQLVLFGPSGRDLLTFQPSEHPGQSPLLTTNWTLTYYRSGGSEFTSIVNGTAITALFREDGIVSGSAGCNAYSAPFAINGSALNIERIITTRASCGGPDGIMEQEITYLGLLGSVVSYRIEGDVLALVDKNGRALLIYSAEQ
jgi:heat shock protein HslJ